MKEIKAKPNYIFEASWEVCNKVGGIYTVVTTKLPRTLDHYNGNYIAIGPYFLEKAMEEFEEIPPPEQYSVICKNLEQEGITLHFGKWLTKGEPFTILVDFSKNIGLKFIDLADELESLLQVKIDFMPFQRQELSK